MGPRPGHGVTAGPRTCASAVRGDRSRRVRRTQAERGPAPGARCARRPAGRCCDPPHSPAETRGRARPPGSRARIHATDATARRLRPLGGDDPPAAENALSSRRRGNPDAASLSTAPRPPPRLRHARFVRGAQKKNHLNFGSWDTRLRDHQ